MNSAARLEPLNKETKTTALVSGELMARVKASGLRARARYMGRVLLIGKAGATELFQVVGPAAVARDDPAERAWHEALALFDAGAYAAARDALAAMLGSNGPAGQPGAVAAAHSSVLTVSGSSGLAACAAELLETAEAYLLHPPAVKGVRRQSAK